VHIARHAYDPEKRGRPAAGRRGTQLSLWKTTGKTGLANIWVGTRGGTRATTFVSRNEIYSEIEAPPY